MAYTFLVQLLIFLVLAGPLKAGVDKIHSAGYLGEKRLDSYSDRYQPLVFKDLYQGKITFEDELFFQNYFNSYLIPAERDLSFFLKSELSGAFLCPNDLFSRHFDSIRFSYRLITLSYLIEAQWQMGMVSEQFQLKNVCDFNLEEWARGCRPESTEMTKFVEGLLKYRPRFDEKLPNNYRKDNWWKEFSTGKGQNYSHYRMNAECKGKCAESDITSRFKRICADNKALMKLICSEKDELYGLSGHRDAYHLIGQSNIINTFNKQGEAVGCLRRFSEVMSHKEVRYGPLANLFPVLQNHLRQKYNERFLQGRVFLLGAGKEYEEKGLLDLYVKDQTLKIEPIKLVEEKQAPVVPPVTSQVEKKATPPKVSVIEAPKKKEVVEISAPVKSAFLQAAEVRRFQNLESVEVDMLKLKYDYVFTLNMLNNLTYRLKTFMTREALTEMMTYDKLGTREGPVPLLFIKFMIDFHEHHGLWNLVSILGERFYVSNEIDAQLKPIPELIQLVNNEATGRQWQIYVLKP